jgi:type VI secretion system secreted protein VgrG
MIETLDVAFSCDAISTSITVASAVVREALSTPASATVSLIAADDFAAEAVVGQPARITLSWPNGAVRHFHLVVSTVRLTDVHLDDGCRYTFELVHEIELLRLRADVRMFQDKDAKEIVAAVLDGAGIDGGHVTFSLQSTPPKRVYCVQYRETDLAFASRLLEHEGIFYFAHDDEGSTHVTFADAQSSMSPIDGDTAIPILDGAGPGIKDLVFESTAAPAQLTVGDYNFETPGVEIVASDAAPSGVGDRFEYTAGTATAADAARLAKLRKEAVWAAQKIGRGTSTVLAFRAGSWFTLEGVRRDTLATKYLITAVEHRVDRHTYENSFTCIPHDRQYRPLRRAPRPKLGGEHTGVVTGPSGSEIHTEALGRMKAKFFWDRLGKDDDTSSCWMRVAQLPIGGSMALGRVGWEMAIAYFDGDLDRPTVISRLYTAEKTSPYGYPGAKTRMSLQTPSSPASGKSNEIRMEDGGGGMEFFVNASKDFDGQTNNNKTETIAVNEKLEVGVDGERTVGANETITIGANESLTVSADAGMLVGADRTKSVGASETVSVSGNIVMTVEGSDTEITGGSHTTLAALGIDKTSKSSHSLTVGGSMISAAGMGVSMMVAGARSETVGAVKLVLSGASVSESIVGAYASTVGGVLVQAAGGNRVGSTKGLAAVTVGGVACANAGGKVFMKGKKVAIRVLGVANFLGGGGIINMTPGSVAFVGMVTLDASSSITISGNPNLVG